MKSILLFLFLCLSISECLSEDETRRVCTFPSVACYSGSVLETKAGGRYLSFQGIRYAQPPTGDLRFKRPVQYEAQEELYDVSATSDIKCLQFSFDKESIDGSEDCLFLNVYVPGTTSFVK